MRLRSLRLAGFKTFVHPTTLTFKKDLTAIVGPNGCGKSNVIDAIRWVMGESSARQLRGEAMSDVIFAGTVNKKPVGQASVELHFENTLGKLGGAYNAYSELSIRRQVSRDGRSDYFLNGTRCRRRDITDIFLGTGLGPRSYAVIEQGMINRLVEAKPEDLRVFIEEAAGVSRYQARRRETEQHLEDTRLNMSRLDDLVEELNRRRRALERQSQAALKHKTLVENRRTCQLELWSIQYHNATQRQSVHTRKLTALGDDFRALRSIINELDQAYHAQSEQLSRLLQEAQPMQLAWQEAERKRQGLVAELHQGQQQAQQLQGQLTTLEARQSVLAEQMQHDETVLADVLALHSANGPRRQELQQLLLSLESQLPALQEQSRESHQELQALRARIQAQELKRSELNREQDSLERQSQRQAAQIAQLDAAVQQIDPDAIREEILDIQDQMLDLQQTILKLQHQASGHQTQLTQLEQSRHELRLKQRSISQTLDGLRGEQRALAALAQKNQPPQSKGTKTTTPEPTGPRLLDHLQLTAEGKAHVGLIEAVLGQWLRAHVDLSADQKAARVLWLRDVRAQEMVWPAEVIPFAAWISKPVLAFYVAWGVVNERATALALQATLTPDQSLITLDGHWIGPDWAIDLSRDQGVNIDDAQAGGILARQLRLAELDDEIVRVDADLQAIMQEVQAVDAAYQQAQKAHQEQVHQISQHSKTQQTLELSQARLDSKRQAQEGQLAQQAEQRSLLTASQEEDRERLSEVHMELASLDIKLAPLREQLTRQEQTASLAQQNFTQSNMQLQQFRMQLQTVELEAQTRQIRIESLQTTLDRARFQQGQLAEEHGRLATAMALVERSLPALMLAVEEGETLATEADQRWQARQVELTTVQTEVQRLEQERHRQMQAENGVRDALEQTRLAWQVEKSQLQQLVEHFASLEATPPEIDQANDLIPQAEDAVAEQLKQLDTSINKLGELNLAAPAELAEVTARLDELNHQMDDLNQTLAQLVEAMQTIDRETRSLFMDTFDRVNAELQQLFPKVFGGGEARLMLEDGWQSGVRFMAQPPGKRNSSIALLSGGEKALTALSLVFAIFKLNPAPFCLLDEVDAPLDDANVARFCRLVTDLSCEVQFIYITHNKLAMMMAGELMGVTMPEAGISKLVAVNVDEAETLVTSTSITSVGV